MSKTPNTSLPPIPNTDDITYINLKERQPQRKANKTESVDVNMAEYATLGERNEEEMKNPTYENLPKKPEEKSFLAKNKWKIIIAGAVIVILIAQCLVIGLARGGVFQEYNAQTGSGTVDKNVCQKQDLWKMRDNIKEDSSNLTNDVVTLKDDISTLTNNVSLLKDDVSSMENDISSLTNDMTYRKYLLL
ncbi:unnamed protein product [Owenia fusiformis]|uniref:Uncharacterized protein n=1 Tax=Owenia fusiformis TaxID=6347 RepID=A0A8S4PW45_OWEFU|nr:unnamed protein product [Owenia fusiformis]